MKIDHAVTGAFLDGLAASVSLYAKPGSYIGAEGVQSSGHFFAQVGKTLTGIVGTDSSERPSESAPAKPATT